MVFSLSSSAFQPGKEIPKQYTCEGADQSPALSWADAPKGTKSFALIVDDPDAPVGTWVHWVLYDLPADTTELPQGVAAEETLASGAKHGVNDFRRVGYGGPCPPPGKPHHYHLRLYALKVERLDVPADATAAYIGFSVRAQALAETQLMGVYGR
jgi:Raf kinase inhibitor-like YbhB/YbcL family protein